jgi:hypothetical protein
MVGDGGSDGKTVYSSVFAHPHTHDLQSISAIGVLTIDLAYGMDQMENRSSSFLDYLTMGGES